ncbi:MAG: hypothetical protein H0T89_10235 [Deltaproteobacteria bacterium]|nr:hypothetical protein [Deltaproteobacteria bacterium]MDQ3298871.1 hypothetical protein [Myxococcota bacterium]
MRIAFSIALVVVAGAVTAGTTACSDRDRPPPPAARVPQPPRRVIEPPAGMVRPLPPHAIRADGVGPYKLGDRVTSLLQQLPSGPRIVRFEIPGIVRTSLIRAEDDTVLIGGETAATFVAVTGREVARTESGVHVGATLAEVERVTGSIVDEVDRARDPRLVVPGDLRNLRLVLANDRVVAIVVTAETAAPRTGPEPVCERPAIKPGIAFTACLGPTGELIEIAGDDLVVRAADGVARLAALRIPDLVFARPLRNVVDGRDEIVAITSPPDDEKRRWAISLYRLEGTRFTKVIDGDPLYELASAQTRWIGAELRDVDLYLEVSSRSDGIEVGGLLTTRSSGTIRDVAAISPVTVNRRQGKATPGESSDAGVSTRTDAGSANP